MQPNTANGKNNALDSYHSVITDVDMKKKENYKTLNENDDEERELMPTTFSPYSNDRAQFIKISKKWTENVIPKRIKEHIINVYHFMDKRTSIAIYDGNVLDIDNIKIFNYGFHDKDSNELLYLVAEKQSDGKYVMKEYLYTKNEVCNAYKVRGNELPISWDALKDNKDKLAGFNVKLNAFSDNPADFCEHVLSKTSWHTLPVFSMVNDNNEQRTFSITNDELEQYVHNNNNKKGWIPMIMLNNEGYTVEYIQMVKIRNNIYIGISYIYDHNADTMKATGIHLHKDAMLHQHQLISPSHDCDCLDEFQSEIDILRIDVDQENTLIKGKIQELKTFIPDPAVPSVTILSDTSPISPECITSPQFSISSSLSPNTDIDATLKSSKSQLSPVPSDNSEEPEPKNKMEGLLRHFIANHNVRVCGRGKYCSSTNISGRQKYKGNDKHNNNKASNDASNDNNNDGSGDASNHSNNDDNDDDDKKNEKNNQDDDDDENDQEDNDDTETDRFIKVFMDLNDYDDESLPDILRPFSVKTVDEVFDGIQQLNVAKLRIENAMHSSVRYQSISFDSRQSDEDYKESNTMLKSKKKNSLRKYIEFGYIPSKVTSVYKLERHFTTKTIPEKIAEPIDIGERSVYEIMLKLLAINIHQEHYEYDKRRIFNVGLHQKETNHPVYFIAEQLNASRRYQWSIHQIYTKDEISSKYRIPSHKLPDPVQIEDLDETKEVEQALVKLKDEIIANTKWHKIDVYNKWNSIRRMTLSLTKPRFIQSLTQFVALKQDMVIIPIVRFGANDRYWMEYVWIVSIEDNVDIGVSFEYNKSNNALKVVGIHLDKELVFRQHQIISPSHRYIDFVKFNSQITDIHIGNPDDRVNQERALKHRFERLLIKYNRLISSSFDASASDIHCASLGLVHSKSSNVLNELKSCYCGGSSASSSICSTPNQSPINSNYVPIHNLECSDVAANNQ